MNHRPIEHLRQPGTDALGTDPAGAVDDDRIEFLQEGCEPATCEPGGGVLVDLDSHIPESGQKYTTTANQLDLMTTLNQPLDKAQCMGRRHRPVESPRHYENPQCSPVPSDTDAGTCSATACRIYDLEHADHEEALSCQDLHPRIALIRSHWPAGG